MSQFLVIYQSGDNSEESQKLMQIFMKEVFQNTVKGCKWRSSTNKRTHFQFDVTPETNKLEVDLFCLNADASTELISSDFQTDDGTHRPLNKDNIKGFIVVTKVEDPKDKKFKGVRDFVKVQADNYRTAKGLGPKDFDFIVGIVNTIDAFESAGLAKKLKEGKLTDASKTFYANNGATLLTSLIDQLK